MEFNVTYQESNMSVSPMCKLCGEYEIGTFQVHNDFCSDVCADRAYDYVGAADFADYGEPEGSYDHSDDAEALASAGWGTDEDYGYYGEDC